MKNNLSQYLDETYHNSASRSCIKHILASKTQQEYLSRIRKQINKTIDEITEIKQSIFVMDQFVSFLLFNNEAQELDGFDKTIAFYIEESNKLCQELYSKIDKLHDYIDILAIAKADIDMNGTLIENERLLIKDNEVKL